MVDVRRAARLGLSVALLAALAGCDTFGMSFGPGASAPPGGRAIDYQSDDLSGLVFALDVPQTLRPVAGTTIAHLDITTGSKSDKHVKASLVLADGDAIDGGLPPPAAGRTYYLFTFADKDKAAVRDAQKWLKSLGGDAAPVIALNVTPGLCETAAVDTDATTYSIVPALPGATLAPIVSAAPVASLISTAGGQLRSCGA